MLVEDPMAGGKMRSPNYPQFSLPESVEFVKQLWNKEKTTSVPGLVVAKALGYSSESGNSKAKIASMKKYGLVEGANGSIKVSRLAMRVIHQALDHPDRAAAIKEAALKPDLFSDLAQTHIHASEEAIRSYLMVNKEFGDSGAKQCAEAFRATMTWAKFDGEPGPADPSLDEFGSEDPQTNPQVLGQTQGLTGQLGQKAAPNPQSTTNQPKQVSATYSWPLSKGVVAELRFSGGTVEPEHLERLRQYLELAKLALGDAPGA